MEVGGSVKNVLAIGVGAIDGVPFKFSEPMQFTATFAAHTPLRLTYRILGASGDAVLLEPVRLEAAP